jgi:hypothetical protein
LLQVVSEACARQSVALMPTWRNREVLVCHFRRRRLIQAKTSCVLCAWYVHACVEAAAACGVLLNIAQRSGKTLAACQSPVLCGVESGITLLRDIQGILVISVRLASAYFITSAFKLRLVKPGTFRPSTSPCIAVEIMKSSS